MWRNWIQRHLTASAEILLHCHCFCEYEGNYAPLMYKYIDSKNCVQPGTLGIMYGSKWFETLQGANEPMRLKKLIKVVQLPLDLLVPWRLYSPRRG